MTIAMTIFPVSALPPFFALPVYPVPSGISAFSAVFPPPETAVPFGVPASVSADALSSEIYVSKLVTVESPE